MLQQNRLQHTRAAADRGARPLLLRLQKVRLTTVCQATVAEGRTTKKQLQFPFTRIQGQEEMKLALMLNVIDPNIGGVLIMGDRGTAKSVAVRHLIHAVQQDSHVQKLRPSCSNTASSAAFILQYMYLQSPQHSNSAVM